MPVKTAHAKGLAVASILLIAVLLLRFLVECVFLLPSPVGDSAYFITASANYCVSGFLGTTTYPIDPTGHARMIWHGFVSPMLFGVLNPGCAARNFYLVLWVIKAATTLMIFALARRRNYAVLPTLGLAMFALAAQTAIGFRPETLAILLVVLAELAIERERHWLLGALVGVMICTQPTVAALYGLSMLITRSALARRSLPIALGCACTVWVLLLLYPFPVLDLLSGIQLQARRLIGRSDGSALAYYLLAPSLPGWSLLLLAAGTLVARHRPLLVLLIPVFWFFGPRVPPVYYNLIPTCVLFTVLAIGCSPAKANMLGAAGLLIGAAGLGLVSARDVLTIRFGDTFRAASAQVAHLAAEGAAFAAVPPFLTLTNPDLHFTDPTMQPAVKPFRNATVVRIFAANGAPHPPCRGEELSAPAASLKLGPLLLFNSNSGWMLYVCRGSN